jgi:hypothetical protein
VSSRDCSGCGRFKSGPTATHHDRRSAEPTTSSPHRGTTPHRRLRVCLSSHVFKHQRGERPPAAAALVVGQLHHGISVAAACQEAQHRGAALWADQVAPATRVNRWQGCLGVSHGSGAHHHPIASTAVAHSSELPVLGRPTKLAPAQMPWGDAHRPVEAIGAGHDPVAGTAA